MRLSTIGYFVNISSQNLCIPRRHQIACDDFLQHTIVHDLTTPKKFSTCSIVRSHAACSLVVATCRKVLTFSCLDESIQDVS